MAPELAVYLYRDTLARGLRRDFLRWKGFRIVVQGSLRQDTGEDIGSQETAHLLDEHDLQLAASKGSIFEVPSVVVAVGDDGQLRHVGRIRVYEVQFGQVTRKYTLRATSGKAIDRR